MLDIIEGIGIAVDHLALDLVGPPGIIPDAPCGRGDVPLGHTEGFAIIKRFDRRKLFQVLFQQIGELGEVFATIPRSDLFPGTFKGLSCGLDGDIDIFLSRFVDGDYWLFGRRIDSIECFAIDSFDEFVVDESEFWRGTLAISTIK